METELRMIPAWFVSLNAERFCLDKLINGQRSVLLSLSLEVSLAHPAHHSLSLHSIWTNDNQPRLSNVQRMLCSCGYKSAGHFVTQQFTVLMIHGTPLCNYNTVLLSVLYILSYRFFSDAKTIWGYPLLFKLWAKRAYCGAFSLRYNFCGAWHPD